MFGRRYEGSRAPGLRRKAARRVGVALAVVIAALVIPAAPALAAPCTEPQNDPVSPALWGGFEIDGNLCSNTTGTTGSLEWDTVGGQPVATDPVGSTDISAFTGGADESSGPNWTVAQSTNASGIPPGQSRDDVGNVYASTQVTGGDVFAYFGVELEGGSGTASLHLELNQKPNDDPSCPRGTRGVPSPCRTVGDLLLAFDKSGGSPITLARVWRWSGSAWVELPDLAGVAAGRANNANVTTLDNRTLTAGRFGEVAVNLTNLFGPASCSGNYGTLNVRTSASTSLTSGLIDWVRPIDLSVPSTCPTVVLQKRWVNGSPDDTARLSVDGATTTPGAVTSTVTADTGATFTDTVNQAIAPVEPGSVVDVAEALGTANTGAYGSTIGCDNGLLAPPQPGRAGSFTMPATADAGTTVTCTFVNTRAQTTLTLTKVWASSTPGDTADLTIGASEHALTGPTTSTAPTTTTISTPVFSGEAVTVAEALGDANASSYEAVTACTNVDAFDPGDYGASFVVPDTPTAISCTITNTAVPARLVLSKEWVRGAPADSAELTITGPDASDSAVSIVPASLTGRSTASASLPIIAGQTVTLAEALPATGRTNTGTYVPTTLECNGQPVAFDPTATGATAQFTVPSSAPVSCVYSNTRQQATVVLQKRWVNGALGDAANLFIAGARQTRLITTSTVTEATGPTFTDEVNQARLVVLTGNRATLSESLQDDNTGAYDASSPTCDNGVVPDAAGSFVVTGPLADTVVTCTITNSRTAGTVTVHKIWHNGVAGDVARLTIGGAAAPADSTSTVPSPAPPVLDDTGHPAAAPTLSGQIVTVAEELGTDNTGTYDSRVVCDNGVSGTSSVTFAVGAVPGSVACTVVNTARPTPPTPSTPVLRTVTSARRVTPGRAFSDRIHVSRLAGARGAQAVARLYGPYASRAAATCTAATLARTSTVHVTNGWNRTPSVRVTAPGIYTWRVTVLPNAANRAVTHPCGEVAETTVVAKRAYDAPAIVAGFSGTVDPSELDRSVPVTIRMPAVGLRAAVHAERVAHGEMTLPGDVGDVGWLRKSAGFADKIGTTVVAGHVSDRHDHPGAMFRLSRAHAGQRVTVRQGANRVRFEVVGTKVFDRRHPLPQRYFATTGAHRLVLVSCTDRVVFPNGHFHYTRYVVVVAKQLRR
ncbi:class F sortase [Nocardioides sp. CER19]|uniref:class F sortase n=1 Tax=Nocardioides sp. CER19 TaxID=3038538 RepID=UPI0024470BC1|nr:class F sortase [Nocardioides sp. CER19]MDH2414464.1 class F sortase [Nocardioides sp. CER19]